MEWLVALSVIAGVLAVDHRVGWQSLLGQPVFAAALVGAILGELSVALIVGVALELVYLSIVPMRGSRVPDYAVAGVVGAGTAGILIHLPGESGVTLVCVVGIFLGLVAGEVGARFTAPLLALHDRVLSTVEFSRGMDRGRLARRVSLLHAGSAGFIFVVEGLVALALCTGGVYVGERLTRLVDGTFEKGTGYWGSLVMAIGAASIVHLFWHHRWRLVFVACAVGVVSILWIL